MNPLVLLKPKEPVVGTSSEVSRLVCGGALYHSDPETTEPNDFLKAVIDEDIESSEYIEPNTDETEILESHQSSDFWLKWKSLMAINWLRTYSQFVQERRRVQAILLTESSRTDKLDISRQGDIDMYTNANLAARRRNKHSLLFKSAVDRLWNIADLVDSRAKSPARMPDSISIQVYLQFNINCQYVILPHPVDPTVAAKIAHQDWFHDIKSSAQATNTRMNYKQFYEAMYEMADTWSKGVSLAEYIQVLNVLFENITEDPKLSHSKKKNGKISRKKVLVNNVETVISGMPLWGSKTAGKKLKSNRETIENNSLFSQTAQSKMTGFTRLINENQKAAKVGFLSIDAAVQVIMRIFSGKEEQLIKLCNAAPPPYTASLHQERNVSLDDYLMSRYINYYGGKEQAKKHLRRLVNTCLKNQDVPLFRVLLKCLGIAVTPTPGEAFYFQSDKYLVSQYLIPLLRACAGENSLKSLVKNNECTYVFKVSFQLHLRNVTKRIPPTSAVLTFFNSKLDHLSKTLQGTKTRNTEKRRSSLEKLGFNSKKLISLKDDSMENQQSSHQEDFRAPNAIMRPELRSKLADRFSIDRLTKRKVIDVDVAINAIFDIFEVDRKWGLLFQHVAAAKVLKKWIEKVFKKGRRKSLSRQIAILSNVALAKSHVRCDSFADVAATSLGIQIVEEITGMNIYGIFHFNEAMHDPLHKLTKGKPEALSSIARASDFLKKFRSVSKHFKDKK